MFEHMPTQCYNLPKLQAPLTITVLPTESLKRKKDEEEIDHIDDEDNFCNSLPCIQRQSRYSIGVYSSPTKIHYPAHQTDCTIIPTHSSHLPTTEEGQPKKLKQQHEQSNEWSTTIASSSLIMNSPFQLFYKPQLTDSWYLKFNMEECVMNFNRYVDDMHDVNVIKMSPQEYFNCCYDFNSTFNGSGLLRLYRDLGFKSFFDYRYFIFVFLFNFSTKLSISRSEWTFGMFNLQCDSVQKLRYQIDKVAEESKTWNTDQMKNLFTVTFKILRESEKSRSIDATIAGYALRVLMSDRSPFTESFSNFLISTNNPFRSINLDQWKIFVDFSANISSNLSNYDSNDAWPSLYDNYLSCTFGLKY